MATMAVQAVVTEDLYVFLDTLRLYAKRHEVCTAHITVNVRGTKNKYEVHGNEVACTYCAGYRE